MTTIATPITEQGYQPGYHQPVSFVPLMKQPHLPHQFDLQWCLVKTHIRVRCNCKWTSLPVKPEDDSGDSVLRLYYQSHLLAEGIITSDEYVQAKMIIEWQ
jgi:hypothetical protein